MATITAPRPQASSNESNSSFDSSQDGRHLSASASDKDDHRKPSNGRQQTEQTEQIEPAEQAESISRRGSQQSISQLNGDQNVETPAQNAQTAKRPGIRSSLSRMLSHKDRPSSGPGDSVKNRERSTSAASAIDEGDSEDSNRPRTISQAGQNPLKSQPNGSVENKLNTVGHSTKEANKDGNPPKRRFLLFEDGTHEHNLKTDKRQETLTDLFRNMFKKGDNAHDDHHQLSLMSSWVDQVKNEKTASDAQGGPNEAHTLVEKYGKCHEVVGRGAFGIVRISHKADQKDPKKEQLYAVKEFRRRPTESPKKYNKRLTSEFCISSALRHPNVIHTLDLMKDAKGDFCEVMEYCAGGDLYTLVLAAVKLEVLEADCYFKQLMRGVEYIHEMGVSHRDLKPENLLLTSRGSLKITDFGNGECFRMAWEKEAHMVAGLCGSAPYIAPEEYIDTEFDPRAVDVWACGVIYMAMRTGRHLWRLAKRDEDDFYDRYCEGRKGEEGYGPIESLHRGRCRNVIYSVLDPNPRRRITASQVLKSEWCSEIKICRAGEEGF